MSAPIGPGDWVLEGLPETQRTDELARRVDETLKPFERVRT